MNYNPAPPATPYSREHMAKWEIVARNRPVEALWWRYMPGVEIDVPWPKGDITVEPGHPMWDWSISAHYQTYFSADPNEHYRPWLEQNVGHQGWDWNWRLGQVSAVSNVRDSLVIKFRKGREKHATIAAMLWS